MQGYSIKFLCFAKKLKSLIKKKKKAKNSFPDKVDWRNITTKFNVQLWVGF